MINSGLFASIFLKMHSNDRLKTVTRICNFIVEKTINKTCKNMSFFERVKISSFTGYCEQGKKFVL
jgi:hypothetical protein